MRLGHINLICAVNYPYLLVYSYFFLVLQSLKNETWTEFSLLITPRHNNIITVQLQPSDLVWTAALLLD